MGLQFIIDSAQILITSQEVLGIMVQQTATYSICSYLFLAPVLNTVVLKVFAFSQTSFLDSGTIISHPKKISQRSK